jgi:hypothetical protein
LDRRFPIAAITDRALNEIRKYLQESPKDWSGEDYIPVIDAGGRVLTPGESIEDIRKNDSPPVLGFSLRRDIPMNSIVIMNGIEIVFLFSTEEFRELKDKVLDFDSGRFVYRS